MTYVRKNKMIFVNDYCVEWLNFSYLKSSFMWAHLVVQWLRVCLSVRGTGVQSLVWEDPTHCQETRPVHHND